MFVSTNKENNMEKNHRLNVELASLTTGSSEAFKALTNEVKRIMIDKEEVSTVKFSINGVEVEFYTTIRSLTQHAMFGNNIDIFIQS